MESTFIHETGAVESSSQSLTNSWRPWSARKLNSASANARHHGNDDHHPTYHRCSIYDHQFTTATDHTPCPQWLLLDEKPTIGMRTLNISIVDVSLEVRIMVMRRHHPGVRIPGDARKLYANSMTFVEK